MGATAFYGVALVLMQFAFRFAPPWRGAAISVPSACLLFWALSLFRLDVSHADLRGAAIFAAVGLMFPASVTLLSMESNRLMGPNVAGAVGNLAPLFAVILAVGMLGERLAVLQAAGALVIVFGVMLLSTRRGTAGRDWPVWILVLPLAGAAVRGAAPPAVKLGLAYWPDALAATTIGYTVSALVLVAAALIRSGGRLPPVPARGVAFFAAIGICNGLSVLLIYAALQHGPVTLVAPLFATYPLVTLLLSRALLREETFSTRLVAGIVVTVAGVVLLILGGNR